MKYSRFEDLPVWKSAIDLATRIYNLTKHRTFAGPGDLASQLRRAALSVSNNIAEGFERGTTAELLTFLYIARGSAGEVRSMLRFVARMDDRAALNTQQTEPGTQNVSEISDLRFSNPKPQVSGLQSQISNPKSQISDLKSEISELIVLAESCSRQIRAWADSLQHSDIKGQRHLTENARRAHESKKRSDAFWRQLDETVKTRLAAQEDESAR